jgi:hypothetical protein
MSDRLSASQRKVLFGCLITLFVLAGHLLLLWMSGFMSLPQQIKPTGTLRIQGTARLHLQNDINTKNVAPFPVEMPPKTLQTTNATQARVEKPIVPLPEQQSVSPVEPFVSSATAPRWIREDSSNYFLREELDIAAEPLVDIGVQFAKLFPVLSGIVIVEFWIDATGRVSRVDIKQGRTLVESDVALAEMLGFDFLPADRAGAAVASRKLIEIDTDALAR